MQRKTLRNFEEGLQAIQQNNDFATLRDLINEMLYICPPEKAHMAKDRIARIMRRKQAYEIQQASNFPDALAAIDQKFKDLAIVLKYAESGGMQIKPFSNNFNGTLGDAVAQQAPPPAHTQAPPPKPAAMARSAPNPMMGMGLKPLLLLNWVKSKKETILKGAAIATVAGGTYFVLQKYFGNGDDKKKNPKDKESDFDKTIRSIQKYRAFSKLSKEPDFGDDYMEILGGKKKKKKKKGSPKKEVNKLDEWEKEEEALMRSMTATHRALAEKPKSNFSLPKLPAPKNNPVPVVSSSTKSNSIPKKKKKKKQVVEDTSPELEEFSVAEEMVVDAPVKPARKSRKKKTTKPATSAKSNGRLIPIVKRTKRVRKIS